MPTRNGDYVGFYHALAATIQDGETFPVSPQDAVDVMTIIELAARSEEEGRPSAVRAHSLISPRETLVAAYMAVTTAHTVPKGTLRYNIRIGT